MNSNSFWIKNRKVGNSCPCFIIAEAGVNHNGDLGMAHRLVDAAAGAGADAVKFQTFRAEKLATFSAPKANYQQLTSEAGESQFAMLKKLELSASDHESLLAHANDRHLIFLSSPFDEESADMLDQMGIPAFKIPSGEVTNLPFIRHTAAKRKPVIMSTGMAFLSEVDVAVRAVESTGNHELILLHTVSNYPADPTDVNLRAMHTMTTAFGYPTGYSDHTLGSVVPLAAVAIGAVVLEKHFTIDRTLPGPDHQASMEASEFVELVHSVRTIELAMGTGRKEPARSEANTASVARRSLVAAKDIPAGVTITEEMIAIKRPGTGLRPDFCELLLGRKAKISISKDTLFTLDMFL